MTIAKQLYAGFGLILLILAVVTGISMLKVDTIDNALQSNNEIHSRIQRDAINFRGSAHDRAIAVRDVVLATSAEERRKEIATINDLAAFYAQSARSLEALMRSPRAAPELSKMYADIQAIEALAVATTQAIIERVEKGDVQGAQQMLWTQAKPQYVQWLAAVNTLIDFKESRIQGINRVAMDEASGFLRVMLLALVLSLALGGFVAWRLSRRITLELGAEPRELSDAARRVAEGNLHPVPGVARAHSSSVLASLDAMRASLGSVVGQVRAASETIASASSQIASGNADLSHRTEDQAAKLQQAASSMDQMTASVQNNADAARAANQLAVSASDAAQKGGEVVGQVVATMDEITTSSRKIADIISVIDGIAFQTNILALNAAVEAARAGEQGRGFAVVAGEVRSLAQRSAQAAHEIKGLIDSSVERVEVGSQFVGQAGAAMTDIVDEVKRVADLIADISAATTEQTSGIAQVNGAVAQLDQATQQNAALVEESAAAADSLSQQAQKLAETVRVFQLDPALSVLDVISAPAVARITHAAPAPAPRRAVSGAAAASPRSLSRPLKSAPPRLASRKTADKGEAKADWEAF